MANTSLGTKIKKVFFEWGLGVLGFILPAIISFISNKLLSDPYLIGVSSVIAYLAGAFFITLMVLINRENAKEEADLISGESIKILTDEVCKSKKKYEAFCRGYSLRDPKKECIAALNDVAMFIDTELSIDNVNVFIKLKIEDINNNIYLSMSVHDFIDFFMEKEGTNVFDENHPYLKRVNFSELKEKAKKILDENNNKESNEFNEKNQFLAKELIKTLFKFK